MLTTNSFQADPQPPRDPQNAADAAAVYHDHDATRMAREAGIEAVASDHTTGPASDQAIGEAFIDGSTIKSATKTAGKQAGASIGALFPDNGPYPDN